MKLPDGSGLWITYTRYLTPTGAAIHGTGLAPAVEIEPPDVEFGDPPPTSDPMLDKAVEQLLPKKAA